MLIAIQMCLLRERAHLQKNYIPTGSPESIAKGTYYLTDIDEMFKRKYKIQA